MPERARSFEVQDDPRTYLRVEIPSRFGLEGLRLFGQGTGFEIEIPLKDAAVVPCREVHTCIEIVEGSGLLESVERIQAVFPRYHHQASNWLERVPLGPYELDVQPLDANRQVRVSMGVDPIGNLLADEPRVEGRPPFLRRYELALAPNPCSASFEVEQWQSFEPPELLPSAFDVDTQAGCVGLRPARPAAGPAVATQTVLARAVATRYRFLYRPPVRTAPLVYLPVFDLEIPSPERCRQTQAKLLEDLESVALDIAQATREGTTVVGLPPVQLAAAEGVACRQSDDRRLDVRAVLQAAESALLEQLPEAPPVRVLLVYATNLPLTAPVGLGPDLEALALALGEWGRAAVTIAIGPDEALANIRRDHELAWTSTLEPGFRNRLDGVLGQVWPFSTVLHDDRTVVPLASSEQLEGLTAWRACEVPSIATPIGGAGPGTAFGPGPPEPGFRVALSRQVLVSFIDLLVPTVEVSWEACYALCERPPVGAPADSSWLQLGACIP